MRTRLRQLIVLACLVLVGTGFAAETSAVSAAIPHLEKRGKATQLIVDGKPFLALGGELLNSSSSSLAYMKPIWPRLTAMHLNTVLAPVSWELIEPQEGKFDFTIVDGLVQEARQHELRLVFLWFGSWKNTYSSYAPEWVKRDIKRFPRVQARDGSGSERLSTFSEVNRNADAHAFATLMRHLRETDSDAHTVIMVQVENEVGVIPDSRDRSTAANDAFTGPVPKELTRYLQQHRETLVPEFRAVWEAEGSKTTGTWEEVFGKSALTDDFFMAWHYAKYINAVTAAGKAEYPLPMFANAALIRPNYLPGQYNSGGPLPHSMDIWRAGAPNIDFLSPDIYFKEFAEWSRKYHRDGNPLFVPEAWGNAEGAANVFYAIGQENAIGFSPFAIDSQESGAAQGKVANLLLATSYGTLTHLTPLILEKQATGEIAAMILEGDSQRAGRVSLGDYTMSLSRAKSGGEKAQAERVSALFLQTGPDEYLVAGSGELIVSFTVNSPGLPIAGIASIDEETFTDGQWVAGRRLNGDENSQGQALKLNSSDPSRSIIYRVRLYRYR